MIVQIYQIDYLYFHTAYQQIRNIEAKTSKKFSFSSLTSMCWLNSREAPIADRLQKGSSTAQVKDTVTTGSAPRQRELCTKDLDTLRSGILIITIYANIFCQIFFLKLNFVV